MTEALSLAAQAAAEDEVPVGAVVVRTDPKTKITEIVGRGYNRREQDENPIAHAEILAIQDAARTTGHWRLTDCALYVTLEPCPMCLAACQQARVEQVYYGASDPKGGRSVWGIRFIRISALIIALTWSSWKQPSAGVF